MDDLKSLRAQGISNRTSRLKMFGGSTQEEVSRVLQDDTPQRASGGRVNRASGGMVVGDEAKPRLDKPHHGKKKGGATTHVNVIVAPSGGSDAAGPGGPPAGGPPMLPPMAGPGPGGLPPMPMRKDGGRVMKKADGGGVSTYLDKKAKSEKNWGRLNAAAALASGVGAVVDPELSTRTLLGINGLNAASQSADAYSSSRKFKGAADKFKSTGLPDRPSEDDRAKGGRVKDGSGSGLGRLKKIGKKA